MLQVLFPTDAFTPITLMNSGTKAEAGALGYI